MYGIIRYHSLMTMTSHRDIHKNVEIIDQLVKRNIRIYHKEVSLARMTKAQAK